MEALVDTTLAQQGLSRRLAVIGHNYCALGSMIACCDLLAVVPARAAFDLARRESVEVHEIPLALPPQPVGLAWSKHGESDPAVRWLRDRLRNVLGEASSAESSSACPA